MYYRITNVIKNIIIEELQDFFKDHPDFGDDLVITDKFEFDERPKFAIIIKSASARSQKLSLDNYRGMVKSYTVLANLKNKPGRMIEWVKEDIKNVGNLVKPGFYVVEMVEDNTFTVTPYLTVADEKLDIEIGSGFKFANLKHQNINVDSELILDDMGRRLQKDVNYTIDYAAGLVTIIKMPNNIENLTIDYQYLTTVIGPITVNKETVDNTSIPGVMLAFGNIIKKGGIQVVVVYPEQQEVAKAFIGKWLMNMNLFIVAQDTNTQETLADLTAMYVWSVLQEKLVNHGIYIDNFDLGNESEEEELQIPNEYSYSADLSFEVNVEWETYQPVLGVIKKIFLNRMPDFGQYDEQEYLVRSTRSFNIPQRGVDYKLGLQPIENFMPVVIRPAKKYTLAGKKPRQL